MFYIIYYVKYNIYNNKYNIIYNNKILYIDNR